jgi:sortase A
MGAETVSRRRVSALQVLGEILLTVGVIVGLYLAWQVWFNNEISSSVQSGAAASAARDWAAAAPNSTTPSPDAEPVVASEPDQDAIFANLIVPRFGDDFRRPIAQGVGFSVLNNIGKGMGHYVGSQMPGEVGNFAIASHRSAYGGAFHTIQFFEVGDPIYVETADGWYLYRYRNTEYVLPTAVGVVAPVPQSDAAPGDRLITMTTCNPLYSSAERIAAFGVFEKFYPRAGGAPAEIATLVSKDS